MDNFLEEATPIKDWPESQKEILRMYAPDVLRIAEDDGKIEDEVEKRKLINSIDNLIFNLQERKKELLK
jgi:hypothetical protein